MAASFSTTFNRFYSSLNPKNMFCLSVVVSNFYFHFLSHHCLSVGAAVLSTHLCVYCLTLYFCVFTLGRRARREISKWNEWVCRRLRRRTFSRRRHRRWSSVRWSGDRRALALPLAVKVTSSCTVTSGSAEQQSCRVTRPQTLAAA